MIEIQLLKERHNAYLFTPEAYDINIYAEMAAEMEMLCVNITWTGYRRQEITFSSSNKKKFDSQSIISRVISLKD